MFLKIPLLSISICLEQLVPENYLYPHMQYYIIKCMYFILLNIFICNHFSIRIVLFICFFIKRTCFLIIEEHMFLREFVSLLAIAYLPLKKVTVVDSLPKWQLSGVVWKIWDSFLPAAGSLTFDEPFNFSLRINLVDSERNRVHSTRFPQWKLFFFVPNTNRRITRRRDFDLVKSSGQLSSLERVDNAVIVRNFFAVKFFCLNFGSVDLIKIYLKKEKLRNS